MAVGGFVISPELPDRDGLCIWIPVKSEQFALVTLAARGIVVLPGQMCTKARLHCAKNERRSFNAF